MEHLPQVELVLLLQFPERVLLAPLVVRVVLGLHLLQVQLVLKIREMVAGAEVQLGELKA
jgi:hypothetical protein